MNGALQVRLRIVNIFQKSQKINSSGMRNLKIGKFVTVRKLRNAKLIWPVRKIPNCVYGGIHFINCIFPGCCVCFFPFFCININLERAGFLSHVVTFEMPKYLKGLIFTQVQCCFSWGHSYSTFNLKTRVSASLILH